jgi:AP-1 complex subunit gamma-1
MRGVLPCRAHPPTKSLCPPSLPPHPLSLPTPSSFRHRNVAKLLYIHMLGYPTHFGQMECIKLLASPKYSEKRIGYLALMLLLDERQEVLTLVTNSLQVDLNTANNPYIVGLALTTVGNIGSVEIVRDLAHDVEKLLKAPSPYVRKKAALCTIRMIRKCPERDLIDGFLPSIVSILLDKNHNVLLAGVSLVAAVMEVAPEYTPKFTKLVPALVKILRKLVTAGFAAEYDVGGVTDPFLQARILSLLRVLGRGNASASEGMNNILAQVASTVDGAKNAGNAVLYECVNTIMTVESEPGLRVLAVNILGKFLAGKDNNIKYVALQTLCKVVHLDAPAVQRHRATIVECLRDGDVSIRRRALELVYALVNADNVRLLTREMLAYLAVADPETRPDLCVKIAAVAARYAPSRRWHIDTLVSMLAVAGDAAKREIAAALLFHVSDAPESDHAAVVHKLFAMAAAAAAGSSEAQQTLLQVAVWCVGEYGHLLLSPPPPRRGASAAAAAGSSPPPPAANDAEYDLTGPFGEQRGESDVVRLLDRVSHLYYASTDTKAMVLTALLKLTARLREPAQLARVRALLASFGVSPDVELQQRSVEFSTIADPARTPTLTAEARRALLEAMPKLDEAVLRARAGAATGETADAAKLGGEDTVMVVQERSNPRAAAAAPAAAAAAAAAAASGPSLLDTLDDLFSTVSSKADVAESSSGANGAAGGAGQDGLDGLNFGFGGPAATTAAASAAPRGAAAPPAPAASLLDDLFASPAPAPAPAHAPSPAPASAMGAKGLDLGALFGGTGSGPAPAMAAAPPAAPRTVAAAAASSSLLDDPFAPASAPARAPAPAPAPAPVDPFGAGFGSGSTPAKAAVGASSSSTLASPALLGGMGGGMGGGSSATAAAAASPFGSPAGVASSTPARGGGGGGDLFDFPASAPSASASSSAAAPFVAYESPVSGLRVTLRCERVGGTAAPPGTTDITATFACTGPAPLSRFVCQVAVPKFMKLTLQPASGDLVGAGGASTVTMVVRIENAQHGVKPLAVRLKLMYNVGGAPEQTVEQTDVKNFPAGF